ncbi:5-deoxy-glucuronate isomerase [Propionicicella superfundia]|uniref:5-deoxy-glucuronate isomerase n=1 Tax=Propionicicella superfundia TaxID=348582 RepID=UPI0004187C00|nr:5-deoxy-glucuronate isomerase [Propionicicella superfundia]
MKDNSTCHIPAGATAHGAWALDVSAERAGWEFSSLRVLTLPAGGSQAVAGTDSELLVLPLQGGCTVEVAGEVIGLAGRESVFADITDYLYVPRRTDIVVHSSAGGRFALPAAKATADLPVRYCPRDEVVTTLRGAGACSRQVNNYALGNRLRTSHLLACEVLTPGGNWSSYPPHKHDVHNADERVLEEIYYYEVRPAPHGGPGFGMQVVYPSPGHEIDVATLVRDGDMVVMPYGYHGPSAAAPGYDLYYLNVMAGPAEDSTWLMTDDPAHRWIRETWDDEAVDSRLPMTPMNQAPKEDR